MSLRPVLAAGLLAGLACARDKPNIVLVMADDQGWGDVAYNGHPRLKTPNLDAMAAAGLRFDRFYAAHSVCSPTRGSVMTGRHPNRFGCFKWGHTLRPQEVTIAEELKARGYVTGHFGKWHLGSVRKGSPVNPGASGFDHWVSAPNFFDNDPILSHEGRAVPMKGESSIVTVDAALQFIRECAKNDKRFFAVVWFGSPHGPHEAVAEDRAHYDGVPKREQNFYGEITGLDRAVGKLRSTLGELGVRDNTVVWYCSDNGALRRIGSTGGHRGHKGNEYEGGLLVPAVLEWPARIGQPRRTSVRCNTSDILPTLLSIVDAPFKTQHPLDGMSLLGLIDGTMKSRPKPMGFWTYPEPGIRTPSKEWMQELYDAQQGGREPAERRFRLDAGKINKQYPTDVFPGHAAWIDGDWKLHRVQPKNAPSKVRLELYDLARDPKERKNLAAEEPERVKRMRAALEAWQASVAGSLNGDDY